MTKWHPLQQMNEILRRYACQHNLGSTGLLDKSSNNVRQWTPAADITESEKEYCIKAELPDVDEDDIHVLVKDGFLTISGVRKYHEEEEEEEEEGEAFQQVECFYSTFSRTFVLPANVDKSRVQVSCKKSVLRVHIPKG